MATGELQLHPRCIGLALSGGAVRGAAHVGVLQVLEEAGIRPAVVAGTSVGSLVGAAYAAGLSAAAIGDIFRTVRWPRLARLSLGSRYSLFDTRPLGRILQERFGVECIEGLARPFAAIACDVLTGERVVFRSGPLAAALRASSAVPGVFPPLDLDGRLLVDGAVLDNLPVGVARDLGADYVIAVDLVPPPSGNRRPRNFLELIMTTGYLWSRANHPAPGPAECRVVPDVADFLGWDLADVAELETRGRAAAEEALPGLRRDLGLGG